jgi:hypothetical protein
VDVVDLEERDRPPRVLHEEVEVRIAWGMKLHLVPLGWPEFDGRRLLEADLETLDP